MSWGIIVSVVGTGVNYINAEKNRDLAEGMAEDARIKQEKAQKQLTAEKERYKSLRISNVYANIENPYEDLTVNQQQANFQAQQMSQQQANMMQGLRGAAGSSGIASLAQAMANQGQLATQRISASIGEQEAMNQRLAAKGAGAADLMERQGEQWVQTAQMDKQATLLGMEYAEATGANLAAQRAETNSINAMLASQQAQADIFSSLGQGLMQTGGGGTSPRMQDPNLVSGIDPANTTGMVQAMDNRSGSSTRGQIISVPADVRSRPELWPK